MKPNTLAALAMIVSIGWAVPASADSTEARCDIYPKGSDKLEKMIPCAFSQRQGYITITRKDGVTHELSPVDDRPGSFRDQHGHPVHRQSGLGSEGLIFRFPDISIFLYWDTSARDAASLGAVSIQADLRHAQLGGEGAADGDQSEAAQAPGIEGHAGAMGLEAAKGQPDLPPFGTGWETAAVRLPGQEQIRGLQMQVVSLAVAAD